MDKQTSNEVNTGGIDLSQLLPDILQAMRRTLLLFLAVLIACTGFLCWRARTPGGTSRTPRGASEGR